MHWLTVSSLRWGFNSGISFIVFLGVLNQSIRYGAIIIILGYFGYLGITIYRDFTEYFSETRMVETARRQAIADNSPDLLLFFVAVITGLFLAFY